MSSQEKQNFISLFTSFAISIPYLVFIVQKYQAEMPTDQLAFWATATVLLVPLRIVAEIIISILAAIMTAIVTQKEPVELTDERDNLIELKATRNSAYAFMIGVFLAMLATAQFNSAIVMFGVLFASGFVSELMGILSKIYYYRFQ